MLGTNIKKFRINKNLSQYELAQKCGVTQAYIAYLENGERKNPTTEVISLIATALGVTINDLLISNQNEIQGKMI